MNKQQRPQSPTVTHTWHASKYEVLARKVHLQKVRLECADTARVCTDCVVCIVPYTPLSRAFDLGYFSDLI